MFLSRITQNMTNNQMLINLNRNMVQMEDLQNQLSTGKKINKPSDDPVGITYSLRYRSELEQNDQFSKNVDSSISWLNYSDSTLSQANSIMQRLRELAVQASNGSNPQTALDAINSEVKQLYGQMVTIGNSQFNGKYVFNGQMTDTPPYTNANAANEQSDNGNIQFQVGVGVKLPVNVTGDQTFGSPSDSDNIFKTMNDFMSVLSTNNQAGFQQVIGQINTRMDKFLNVRADVGAKIDRVQLTQSRIQDINTNLQTLQSNVEDVDVAQAVTNLKTAQNVYQSSLSVGAKIIQPSLIDFLK